MRKSLKDRENKWGGMDIFLDSGAFSAFVKNAKIDIEDYINFVKRYQKHVTVYANLDVIGNARETMKNQKKMERAGLTPLPTYHFGEEQKYLDYYIENYDYIALGGVAVKRNKNDLSSWLDQCFDFICDTKDRLPKVKVHGFGITAVDMMLRYPWYSVDSTSWIQASRMGTIYVPNIDPITKKDNYLRPPLMVSVSSQNADRSVEGSRHFNVLSPHQKKIVVDYVERQGFHLGKSVWKKEGGVEFEEVIYKGLCNDYRERDKYNFKYFINLEKALPPWPQPFPKLKIKKLF